MRSKSRHVEGHRTERMGWLRASVLGANDGIVSTGSLLLGIAAAGTAQRELMVAGVAGLVAGAMSMAAGEYVSVSSQADAEGAELDKERRELDENPEQELDELTRIYQGRGLERALAEQVARALSARDALSAHRRDELGLTDELAARPWNAALASAASFAIGAAWPLGLGLLLPPSTLTLVLGPWSLIALATLGGTSAWLGGAPVARAVLRVSLGGAVAMAASALVGHWFGAGV